MRERTSDYRQKRNFDQTPEPSGNPNEAPSTGPLRFVVQRHDATRLHFDLRLEYDGVYKSWAVTNEPTEEVGSRRLAVHVEDHPLAYGTFEGEIPEGNYGAGSVTIWDSGIWIPESDPGSGLKQGKLNFELRGERMQGRWTLVQFGQRDLKTARKDNWLLIKRHDDKSSTAVSGAVKGPMELIEIPQLATLVAEVPTGSDWWFEPKLDGYRLLARIDSGTVVLTTRNGHDWTDRFGEIAAALAKLPCQQAMLDGEVVVFDSHGVTQFQRLQAALAEHIGQMHYVLFDLLHLDEWDLRPAPLRERKALLAQLLSASAEPLRYGDHLEGDGDEILAHACDLELEGVIAKEIDAPYQEGRTRSWLKLKCALEQEFVVVGFTDPKGARQGFGALLLATREMLDEPLRHVGRAGTGFDGERLRELRKDLDSLAQSESAVPGTTHAEAGPEVHWVAPELVAQVSFAGWTDDGHLRHAVFHGLREDRKAESVVVEHPEAPVTRLPKPIRVRLTHPDKVLFTDPDITKRQMADYWKRMAPFALPFVQDRPLSLLRCPDGIDQCFYQKHIGAHGPEGIARIGIAKGEEPYAMIEQEQAFAGLVQWGVIEVHAWGARAEHLDKPDILVFDLDPAEGLAWSAVVDAAEELKGRIEALGLVPFAKLTGGKGLHIVIPVIPGADWDAVKVFTRAVATDLVKAEPNRFTVSISKAKRTGKIFIDYLRNDRESTAIAPYSPRARPGAPVALPIAWSEVLSDRGTQPVVTIADVTSILRSHTRSHPWKEFERSRRSLTG